jgi:hypothetical protein
MFKKQIVCLCDVGAAEWWSICARFQTEQFIGRPYAYY